MSEFGENLAPCETNVEPSDSIGKRAHVRAKKKYLKTKMHLMCLSIKATCLRIKVL